MPSEQKIEFRRPASVYMLSVSVHDAAPARLANAHQASSQPPALNPAKDSGPNGEHKQRRPADLAVPHHSPLEMAGVLVHVTIGPACVVGGKPARTQVNDHRSLPSRPAGPAPNSSPATVSSAARRSRMFIKLHRLIARNGSSRSGSRAVNRYAFRSNPAVPRHRHRFAHGEQHARGGAGAGARTSTPTRATWTRSCNFIPDADDPYGLIRRYLDAVPSGSYLAISHASSDLKTDTGTAGRRYNSHSATAITFRSRQEVTRLLAGLELVPPGVSPLDQWSLGATGTGCVQLPAYAALARKP